MARRRPILLLTALMALTVPSSGADAACKANLPAPSDRRAASYVCTGVRVGMTLVVPSRKWGDFKCGASFAFADSAGNKYLTFPGSCFLDYDCLEDTVYETLPPPLDQLVPRVTCLLPSESEEEPYFKANGPVVKDVNGRRVGRIAYAVNKDDVDFALVRVDPAHRLDHSVPMYGGPLRMGDASVMEETYVYSPGDDATGYNARTGLLSGSADYAYVLTQGLLMQSRGSSVMKPDGVAVGLFNGYLTPLGFEVQPLGAALERAQRQTRLKLRLLTAPLK